MARLVVTCPSCSGELQATRLSCAACGTSLDGSFTIPALMQLSAEELTFVREFVRESGSLKAIASRLGVSYPTVRNRLDGIIARLDELEKGLEQRRHAILDALEKGELSSKDAEAALRKVGL